MLSLRNLIAWLVCILCFVIFYAYLFVLCLSRVIHFRTLIIYFQKKKKLLVSCITKDLLSIYYVHIKGSQLTIIWSLSISFLKYRKLSLQHLPIVGIYVMETVASSFLCLRKIRRIRTILPYPHRRHCD